MPCDIIACDCDPLFKGAYVVPPLPPPVPPMPPPPIPPPCTPTQYSDERPNIGERIIAYFSSGASFPSGTYTVRYLNGAMKYNVAQNWCVNHSEGYAFQVVYSGGMVQAPTDYTQFTTQAAVEAHNAGAEVTFYHSGGKIGVFLQDSPYNDNIAGSPNPTFRLFQLCGGGGDTPTVCGGTAPSIESLMRAFQERRWAITGTYIDWPDSTITGDPGNYPVDHFYDSDIAAAIDPDQRRADLLQSISDVLNNSWLNSYSTTTEWDGLATIPTYDTTSLPPITVTTGNLTASSAILASYCCALTVVIKTATSADNLRKLAEGNDPDCSASKMAAISAFDGASWSNPGFFVPVSFYETAAYQDLGGGNFNYRYQIQANNNTFHYNLSTFLITNKGVVTSWGVLDGVGDGPAHELVAPALVDSLFHQWGSTGLSQSNLGEADATSSLVPWSNVAGSSDVPCPSLGFSSLMGWQETGFMIVQVYKSNVPSLGHWLYYP